MGCSFTRMEKTEERPTLTKLVGGLKPRCLRCGSRFFDETSTVCPGCNIDPVSPDMRTHVVPRGSRQREFLRGVAYLPRGAWKALTSPHLWPTLALLLVLNVIFVLSVTTLVIPPLENWLRYTTAPESLAQWTGTLAVFRYVARLLGWLVRTSSYFAIPALTAWILSTPPFRVILAALSTHVSEQIERDRLRDWAAPFSLAAAFNTLKLHRSMGAAVLSSLVLTLEESALYVATFPIALVPVVGTFAWLVFPRCVFAGLDLTDPTLCRKLYYPGEKVALWWTHRWRLLGLGCAFFFVLGIPVLSAFAFPVAAAGGALLYFELDRK